MFKDLQQTRVNELRLWHDMLEDAKLREGAPDDYRAALRTHVEVLERLGVISTQECFDLKRQADDAYALVRETLEDDSIR